MKNQILKRLIYHVIVPMLIGIICGIIAKILQPDKYSLFAVSFWLLMIPLVVLWTIKMRNWIER